MLNIVFTYKVIQKHLTAEKYLIDKISALNIFESSVYNILKDYGLKVISWNSFSCEWEM